MNVSDEESEMAYMEFNVDVERTQTQRVKIAVTIEPGTRVTDEYLAMMKDTAIKRALDVCRTPVDGTLWHTSHYHAIAVEVVKQ